MERRKILLGSGTAFATALAGCASSESAKEKANSHSDKADKQDEKSDNRKEKNNTKTDEKDNKEKDGKEGKDKEKDIPGFDRDAFHIDSDVIRVKDVTYRNRKFDLHVMVTTTDRNVLAEELRALAPGLARAIRNADEFLAEVEEINFTLYDEHKKRVFAVFLDVQWLREFLDGDITNDEFVNRILDLMEQA